MLSPRPPIPPTLMDWKFLLFQSKLCLHVRIENNELELGGLSATARRFAPFVQLWPEATLLCAHGPTVLTNPEPCRSEAVRTFSPPTRRRRAFIATGRV
jgi:hypothetical protein